MRRVTDAQLADDEELKHLGDQIGLGGLGQRSDEPEGVVGVPNYIEGAPTAAAAYRLRRYIREAREYEDYLYELEGEELFALLNEADSAEYLELSEEAMTNDQFEFFSLDSAAADVRRWTQYQSWTEEEATALSLGKEPKAVNSATLDLKNHAEPSAFREEYRKRLDLIRRAVSGGAIANPITPRNFVHWISSIDLDIPSQFLELRSTGLSVEGLNDEDETLLPGESKSLGNILRVLMAVSAKQYGIDPLGDESQIDKALTDLISAHIREAQVNVIHEKTIRKWLTRAIQRAKADNTR